MSSRRQRSTPIGGRYRQVSLYQYKYGEHVHALLSWVLQWSGTVLLTHWGRDKMAVIFQTTFSNAFPWMKMNDFRLRFHWSLFPKGRINNIPSLVQIMACRRPGDKPLTWPMIVSLLTHTCVTRPQGVNPNRVGQFHQYLVEGRITITQKQPHVLWANRNYINPNRLFKPVYQKHFVRSDASIHCPNVF